MKERLTIIALGIIFIIWLGLYCTVVTIIDKEYSHLIWVAVCTFCFDLIFYIVYGETFIELIGRSILDDSTRNI